MSSMPRPPHTLSGVLIAESLHTGSELKGVPLQITAIQRITVGDATAGQPEQWTLLDFQAPEEEAERLAGALAGCLSPTGGWYVDYSTATEAYVVFADRVFRYARGDAAGRAEAEEYARSVGVPESQLDWED